jgi:hypothetical protein
MAAAAAACREKYEVVMVSPRNYFLVSTQPTIPASSATWQQWLLCIVNISCSVSTQALH